MKEQFPGYYPPSGEILSKLWQDAIFVFDANVLLNFYRLSDDTRNTLFLFFEKFKNRIFVPYQVAEEYHRNITNVVTTQISKYDETIKELTDVKALLTAKRSHPFFSKNFQLEVDSFHEKFEQELKQKRAEVRRWLRDNPIKERLATLLENSVGQPYNKSNLETLHKEGADRFSKKIPPGYADAKDKPGDAKYGDWIVWKQTMEKAKADKRDVIFITGDEKEDWFVKHHGQIISARPELLQEFITITEQRIYIYTADGFLLYANEYLQSGIKEEVIQEVKNSLKEGTEKNEQDEQSNEVGEHDHDNSVTFSPDSDNVNNS